MSEIVRLPSLDLPRAAFDFCLALEARGASFTVKDGKLTVNGVKLTPAEREMLKTWKQHAMAMVEYRAPEIAVDEVAGEGL